jgi:hypothetical protein
MFPAGIRANSAKLGMSGLALAMLALSSLPAPAATIGTRPGLLQGIGQSVAAQIAADVEVLFVRSDRGSERRAGRATRSRSVARDRRPQTRVIVRDRRPRTRVYIAIPPLVVPHYYYYYEPRSYLYAGRCEYWHQRCVAN